MFELIVLYCSVLHCIVLHCTVMYHCQKRSDILKDEPGSCILSLDDDIRSLVPTRCMILFSFFFYRYAVAQLVEALRYKAEGRGFDFRWGHWDISLTTSFRPHCVPGVDSASNRIEYLGYIMGGKGGRCWQTSHLRVPIVWKLWEPYLIEVIPMCSEFKY